MENLRLAFTNASRGKSSRKEVREFASNLEENLTALRDDLINKTFTTSKYKKFIKYEPKRREIFKLPFRDRIVHWAVMLVVEPIWVSTLTTDTYSCIKNRGIHDCLHKLQNDLRADPEGTAYCLKLDITKYYPSINHQILKAVVRRRIKDKDLLWLLDDIIDSADGVPIGNYLSQFFANLYLSEFDHQIKEVMKVRYYYRYADDMVVLSGSKEYLNGLLVWINNYLMGNRLLSIKGNYQVFPVESRGIDFLGYVCFHTHTLMRKSIKKNLCKKVARLNKCKNISDKEYKQAVCSWLGWAKHCDSKNLIRVLDMKKFSDVQKNDSGNFTGDKVKIEDIIGKPIQLVGFSIGKSKYHDQCLTMQIKIEEVISKDGIEVKEWIEHICFTGSEALMRQLKGVEIEPNDPVLCKIIKQNLSGNRCFYKLVDPD